MRPLAKLVMHYLYRPWAIRYISRDRVFARNGLEIKVPTGVFHPGLFFSSTFLADFILSKNIAQKSALEIGCGSGYISLEMARVGAEVTAIDVSEVAVDCTRSNALENQLPVKVLRSDLLKELKNEAFDFVVINPPYYKRDPKNTSEKAWFAGSEFQYFNMLFQQLPKVITKESEVYMCASEDVQIEEISTMAKRFGFEFQEVLRKRIWWEQNYVYQLVYSF